MLLGIDPGLDGALVVYDPTQRQVRHSANIPTLDVTRNGKSKREINIAAMVALAQQWAPLIKHAFIERVGPMPKQGVSSVWSFSAGYHVPLTAVVACGIPYSRVTPQTWKKAVGAPADKDGAILRASQLMPASAHLWTPLRGQRNKAECEGIAEAALIAWWGSTQKICVDA